MLHWEARKAVLQKRRSTPAPLIQRIMAWGPIRAQVVKKMRTEVSKKAKTKSVGRLASKPPAARKK